MDTRIDICCAAKPGLLLSTVNTIEALGLEIQQCVISCFNDFSMQASCSEVCVYKLGWPIHMLAGCAKASNKTLVFNVYVSLMTF